MRVRTADGRLVGHAVELAHSFWARARGLLGRPGLPEGGGLWLEPGGAIHTLGMRFAIDAVFLDPQHRVLSVSPGVRPWRLRGAPRGTCSVLEIPAGQAARCALARGETLIFDELTERGTAHG